MEGKCFEGDGENGEWRMQNGEWRMENAEWRMCSSLRAGARDEWVAVPLRGEFSLALERG